MSSGARKDVRRSAKKGGPEGPPAGHINSPLIDDVFRGLGDESLVVYVVSFLDDLFVLLADAQLLLGFLLVFDAFLGDEILRQIIRAIRSNKCPTEGRRMFDLSMRTCPDHRVSIKNREHFSRDPAKMFPKSLFVRSFRLFFLQRVRRGL